MVSHETDRLAQRLTRALHTGDEALRTLEGAHPRDRHDRFLTLQRIHELHRSPLHEIGEVVRWQHHPGVAALKQRLEAAWIAELDGHEVPTSADTGGQLQALAAGDRSPAVYRWIAEEARWEPALCFLALEGGPDDVFDDLVATCQVGLPLGPAKMELAHNYWDEMGNGDAGAVHNVLYQRFVEAVGLPRIPAEQQPTEALERSALLGLLATNRHLQPELVGALGLIELEAGPHCRYVEQGLARLGAPQGARDFYAMHAAVDPLHGKAWVDNAVGPLVERFPAWGRRILRGAVWKRVVNRGLCDWAERELLSAVPA